MDFGRIGIWTYQLNYQPASKVREIAAELEELGYGALWIGESAYREPLTHAGFLLSVTNRMVVATGIANIWARDPLTMTAAQLTLTEAYPERFLLGLGVSHARLVEGIHGHQYQQPFAAMRRYLDGMDAAAGAYRAVRPAAPPPRALAALGPRMLALAAVRAWLAGHHAETRRALPRATQGPHRRAGCALPGDQEAHQEAPHQADQGQEGRLSDHSRQRPSADEVSGWPSMPAGLNHKLLILSL